MTAIPPLAGVYTALVTPFSADGGEVDHEALERHVEDQLAAGVAGLVPCGTTGEAPTLAEDEQLEVIRRVAATARRRVPVFAGTGTFSTKKTVAASRAALAAGADGVMLVMPYYSKPSQAGLTEHVVTVAAAVNGPILLYNIPGRSVVDLAPETVERICAAAPNVVAIKEATNNVLRAQELVARLGDRLVVLSGDDALTLPMMAVGARGVVSVTSNVLPREVVEVVRRFDAGDLAGARAAHLRLLDVHAAMFGEPNPAPAKAALASAGRMHDAVRLPLVAASPAARARVAEALARVARIAS